MKLGKSYKVAVVEADFFAARAIASYLAWDRRTRMIKQLKSIEVLIDYLASTIEAELPDTILLDASILLRPQDVQESLARIKVLCKAHVIVMSRYPIKEIAQAVYESGGRGYVIREDVGLQVSWMVGWAREYPFVVTPASASLYPDAAVLPDGREFPELTDRVRQALMLCVVEGMSAELAADEMGLSPHTIRTYIKEGYSILEANDQMEYPTELSPQEKAFMRFTALSLDHIEKTKHDHEEKQD
ncbi:MAG TPA: sigma factor-like helix-turn-helix DNA-binding protein [Aggregatilineales bacterium]|nr:sigma factor-like helix-turn-helix DNA-binding protein [Aggregatilineales bacterium]